MWGASLVMQVFKEAVPFESEDNLSYTQLYAFERWAYRIPQQMYICMCVCVCVCLSVCLFLSKCVSDGQSAD